MMEQMDFRTVSELVEDYLSERLPRPATCHMYREVAQRWVNDTGNDVVERVSAEDVREWRGAVLARASAQTWNLYRRHLRALWNHAMRRKACTSNPFADTAPARAPSLRKKTVDSCRLVDDHQGPTGQRPEQAQYATCLVLGDRCQDLLLHRHPEAAVSGAEVGGHQFR